MAHSAWGLSTPSDLPWQARARCAEKDVDPDWWSADGQLSSDPRPAAHQPPESTCGWCAWPPVNGARTFAVAGVR